ncbi:MAG: transglutaminase-like putative cysteine protease, partial [Pirellulaceae bacterium]
EEVATAHTGITPSGITPSGITPSGITPSGITPSGITPSGITPSGATQTPPGTVAVNAITEYWDIYYIQKQKIGYGRTELTSAIDKNGDPFIKINSTNFMVMKRFGDAAKQEVAIVSFERPDGALLKFASETKLGPVVNRSTGEIKDGDLVIVTETAGKKTTSKIDWNKSYKGLFAPEQSLRQKPMKPGQRRTVQSLFPIFNSLATVQLDAVGYEETDLLDTKQRLLRIDSTISLAGGKLAMTMWVDEKGESIKTFTPGIGQFSYRTTKEIATSTEGTGEYDLGKSTTVRVAKRIAKPHSTQRIKYRAVIESEPSEATSARNPIESIFVSGPTQTFRKIDDKTIELLVRAVRPDNPATLTKADTPPTQADLSPNNLIQSDDQQLVRLANEVLPGERDPWRLVCGLERHVDNLIRETDFTQAFATAAEVAQSRRGDCTEHAVLLAGFCRARKIPARVAMGLVYFELNGQPSFGYHMWTEVWIKDRWIPMDATLGRQGIGAAHIKVAHSNLDGAAAFSGFLPVYKVLGRLKLEIVSVQ